MGVCHHNLATFAFSRQKVKLDRQCASSLHLCSDLFSDANSNHTTWPTCVYHNVPHWSNAKCAQMCSAASSKPMGEKSDNASAALDFNAVQVCVL